MTPLFVPDSVNRCLLFLFLFLSCSEKKGIPATENPVPVTTTKTFLALGDSYTIGQNVTAAERFPSQTVDWLRLNGVTISGLTYIATTGWTTTNLQNALTLQAPANHDVVTLLIGVNDQYQTRDTTGYRQRFTGLLERAVQLAYGKKSHVFVLSIPDYSVTPFASSNDTAAIRKEINLFNSINQEVTQNYQVTYLDITPSTREALTKPELLASDGLHPSGLEYSKWAKMLGPLLLPVLK